MMDVKDFSTIPDRHTPPPRHPLLPTEIFIETRQPESGWWRWFVSIRSARFKNGRIEPSDGTKAFNVKTLGICLGYVFDPIPELHDFLFKGLIHSAGDVDPVVWAIDEEGVLTRFLVWHLSESLLQVEIQRSDDTVYSLVVDRENFIEMFLKAYCEFGAKGGRGRFGDGLDSGPCCSWPIEFELKQSID